MVTEDYVSFKVAKLLKEKGFDEKTLSYYEDDVICLGDWFEWNRSPLGHISAPTLQMAMKWLREEHNIFIQIALYSKLGDYCFEVFQNTHRLIVEEDEVYDTYEQACEAAIKYCLKNLI